MTEPAGRELRIEGLDAWYGQAQVLFGVDIVVREREIVGVFGHNGAGKSTLLRVIARLHAQARGRMSFDGRELFDLRPHAVARLGLNLVREGAKTFESMTVDEHLALARRLARRSGKAGREAEQVFGIFPMLKDRRKERAGFLSGGQRQALVLAAAFTAEPACLLLDEPSTGLAAVVTDQVYETIRGLADHGVALLIAEQNPDWLAEISPRGYLLETGRVRAGGDPSTFLRAAAPEGLEVRS